MTPSAAAAAGSAWAGAKARLTWLDIAVTALPLRSSCQTTLLRELPDMMSEGRGSWKCGHSKGGCVNFIV